MSGIRGLHDIPVVLRTVSWPVLMFYPRGRTQFDQGSSLICLWVKQTRTGALDVDSSFPVGISNQHAGWGGFRRKGQIEFTLLLAGTLVMWSLASLGKSQSRTEGTVWNLFHLMLRWVNKNGNSYNSYFHRKTTGSRKLSRSAPKEEVFRWRDV